MKGDVTGLCTHRYVKQRPEAVPRGTATQPAQLHELVVCRGLVSQQPGQTRNRKQVY